MAERNYRTTVEPSVETLCQRPTCSMEFVFNMKVVDIFARTSVLDPEEFSGGVVHGVGDPGATWLH